MRILLIRHGESVDNVAGLYAGSRDSPLTNHGVLQIKRLGAHLAKRNEAIGPVKYIFTSTLRRAYQTADAIAEALAAAQSPSTSDASEGRKPLKVSRLTELREKDYGSSEGTKFGVKAKRTADGLVQSDSETHESMKIRVNRFLSSHLIPITDTHGSDNITVVIVAHGIILGVLLKALLERFSPEPAVPASSTERREAHPEFAAWSNTGVLQARLKLAKNLSSLDSEDVPRPISLVSDAHGGSLADSNDSTLQLVVEFTNNLEHLEGLKKTRGGIGSAKFDSRQRTMDSFFNPASKKRKLEEARES
ncbi:phosphoglycerate mutase-like protein [Hypoxylon sp. FL0890]|nr:phosphoglycerate mutase-like protein [Hypoxylon sp. FL0890]